MRLVRAAAGWYLASALALREIGIDASQWDEPTTGIGLYTRMLVGALEADGLVVHRYGARSSGEFPRGTTGRTWFTLGVLPRLLARTPEPLYHAVCNFNLPLGRVAGKKLVLTVHDLIPDLLPQTVSLPYRLQFRAWLSRSLRIADAVVCDSERSRQDLLGRFEVKPEKVTTVHLAVDHIDAVPAPDAAGRTYLDALALPEKYVLYAGALDARKNVELVLSAAERFHDEGRPITVVFVGQRWFGAGPIERRIADLRARGVDLRPLGYQPPPLFYELIRRARMFVFPSRYEGFGLPPLEAMHLGVPCIVSTAGSLPEVCGDAALQVDPEDAAGLVAAIGRLLDDDTEAKARGEAGRRWSRRYTWAQTARKTRALYAQLLG